jgi:hypothetical protein
MPNKLSHSLPLAFLATVILVFCGQTLFTGQSYFIRDITYLFHPWRVLSAESLQHGSWPLWNHYSGCGLPLMANWQSSVFYPFTLLFYIFSFAWGLKLFHLCVLSLGGIFAYLFGRRSGYSRWTACGMGILFALNGYMVTRLEFLSLIGTIVWVFPVLPNTPFYSTFVRGSIRASYLCRDSCDRFDLCFIFWREVLRTYFIKHSHRLHRYFPGRSYSAASDIGICTAFRTSILRHTAGNCVY